MRLFASRWVRLVEVGRLLLLRHGLGFLFVLVLFCFHFVFGVVVLDEVGDAEADELFDGEWGEAEALCFRDEGVVDVEYAELDELIDCDVRELLFGRSCELRSDVLDAESRSACWQEYRRILRPSFRRCTRE